jgi:hypothetical protein
VSNRKKGVKIQKRRVSALIVKKNSKAFGEQRQRISKNKNLSLTDYKQ